MATINSALYSNIDGGNKLLRYLYNNIEGVRKNTNVMYGNLDGSSRQVFPISVTEEETVAGGSTVYTWNKYNITKIPKLYYSSGNNFSDIHFLRADKIWKINSYNVCLNSKKTYGDIEIVSCELYGTFGDFINRTIPDSVIWVYSSSNPTGKLVNTHGGLHGNTVFCGGTFDTIECDDGDSGYGTCIYAYNVREYFVRQEDGKGSTSYGTVTSTSRSAYPDNNYSGSYWYVYAGSTSTGPTVYKWKKYSVNTSSSEPELYSSGSNTFIVEESAIGDMYCMQNASFTPYNNNGNYRFTINSASSATIKVGFKPSGYFYHSNLPSGYIGYAGHEPYVAKAKSAYYSSGNDIYIDVDLYHYRAGSTTQTQGSTSYGEVTSTSRSAYPDNGVSGNYWYVYQGSSQSSGNSTITIIYDQIPAIQSSGAQYINSGFKPNQNTRIVLDCEVTSNGQQQALFGSRTSGGNAGFAGFTYNDCNGYQIDYNATQ